MKSSSKVGIVQIDPLLGDIKRNVDLHLEALETDMAKEADMVVFPELSLTGYLLQDLVAEVAVPADGKGVLKPLVQRSREKDIIVGIAEKSEDFFFYNSALYLSRGKIHHVHRKVYLPTYGMFDEGRYFAAGRKFSVFDTGFGKVGMLICEDAWHLTSPYLLAVQGAHIIVVLSNSPERGFTEGGSASSVRTWEKIGQVMSQLLTVFWIYANRTGYEEGIAFAGSSYVSDPFGNMLEKSNGGNGRDGVFEICSSDVRRARTITPLLRDENVNVVARHLERILREDK